MDTLFCIHIDMILLIIIGYGTFTTKGYQISPEVSGGQKEVKVVKRTQGLNFMDEFSYDIPDPHML